MNIDEFSQVFFQHEIENRLADWRITLPTGEPLAPWPILRFPLFREATQLAGLYDWERDTPPPVQVANGTAGVAANRELLESLGLRAGKGNPLKRIFTSQEIKKLLNSETLIVPFYRRDSNGIDKFTQFIERELGGRLGIIGSSPFDGPRGLPRYTAMNKFAFETFGSDAEKQIRKGIQSSDLELYQNAILICEQSLGVKLEENKSLPYGLLSKFLAEFEFWKIFFKHSKAKRLILPFSGIMSLIGAARHSGVKVCEIQHGLFNPYPMRFNWPGSPEVPYLANEIWTWGNFWTQGFELPAGQLVKVMGRNQSLDAALTKSYEKNENQITFIAQPAASEELFDAAELTARALPSKRIIFRLHPGDSGKKFLDRLEGLSIPNITISSAEPDILTLLAESSVVVGVFSTTLIEAAALGTPSVILKASSWSRLQGLIDAGDAVLANSIEDVPSAISRAHIVNSPDFYYDRPRTLSELLGE